VSNIQYSLSVNVNKAPFSLTLSSGNVTAVQNTAGVLAQTLILSTTTSAVSTASASALGFAFLRNIATATASTATVSFGRVSGTTLFDSVTLRPGEVSFLRLSPGNYAARAAVTGLPLLVQILED
jgi:hypothetical protein